MARPSALLALPLLLALAPRPAAAADSFWLPLADGLVLSFMTSGQILRSSGESESFGPVLEQYAFQAVDFQLLDHHVDLAGSNGDLLQRRADGWFRVGEDDPTQTTEYSYYIDPEPFTLETPFEPGEQRSYAGARRGQWAVPGGGYEAWSGTWSTVFTHLGHAPVTTPLGSFDAALLQVHSTETVDQRALFPQAFGLATWTETWWVVAGVGVVQVQGSGLDQTDYGGDGVYDRWTQESRLMVAVPEPATAGLLAAGLLALAVRRRASSGPCRPCVFPPR